VTDIPRGKYLGERLGEGPAGEAEFEIRIDGTPRSYRDRKDYAMEAARLIKSKNPHSMVEVKDLRSGDVTAVALRPLKLRPTSLGLGIDKDRPDFTVFSGSWEVGRNPSNLSSTPMSGTARQGRSVV
jgi:hypothetical protein